MRENRRTVVGKVASAKMQKTVVVTVHRLELHPKYKKYVRKRTKLYAHDDQVGPFSRVEVSATVTTAQSPSGPTTGCDLGLSWKGSDGKCGSVGGVSLYLLVPVYHKVRISYDVIEDAVSTFDEVLHVLRQQAGATDRLEWDIYLTSARELKSSTNNNPLMHGDRRKSLLAASLPRFLWRATAYAGSTAAIDLLFDALFVCNSS